MPGRYWPCRIDAGLLQHVGDRNDGILVVHHHAGADVEDLDDVRRLSRLEGVDARLQRFRIGSLEDRNDTVVGVAGVEFLGERLDDLGVRAADAEPELQLGRRKAAPAHGGEHRKTEEDGRQNLQWSAEHFAAKRRATGCVSRRFVTLVCVKPATAVHKPNQRNLERIGFSQ